MPLWRPWVVGTLRWFRPAPSTHEAGGRSLKRVLHERIAFARIIAKAAWEQGNGRADRAQTAFGCRDKKMCD